MGQPAEPTGSTIEPMAAREFLEADGVEDWRIVSEGACLYVRTASLSESAKLVRAIAEIDGIDDHAPALDVRDGGVTVRLITVRDDYYGPSRVDLELAQRISAAVRDLGLSTDPARVQSILVIPGAPDVTAVLPFWRAILGYEPRPDSPDEDLVDPMDRGPAFWFETMDEPRPGGGGAIHLSVWVPHDQAEARIAAALAAGGRMVRDKYAPAWWTLADAAGNEVDISTVLSRD